MATQTPLVPTADKLACSLGDVLVRYAQSLKYGINCNKEEYLKTALDLSTILTLYNTDCDDTKEYIENLYVSCIKPTLANFTPTEEVDNCSSFLVEVIDHEPIDCSAFSISVVDACPTNSGNAATKPFNLILG